MLIWIIKLSALSLGLSYATPSSPCQKLHHTQLTSLNERMNQMIEALYSSSILAKPKSDGSESSVGHDHTPTSHYETPVYPSYLPTSPPHVIYVAPPAVPTLAYAPPIPYPPSPPPIPAYYPPEPLPPPEYPPGTVRYSWAPTTYNYEHTYQPPQAPPPLPPVYPPQYPHPAPKPYEYTYAYPTEYPSPIPYAPRPQPVPHYAPIAEYASHPPYARYSELIPTPPKYM